MRGASVNTEDVSLLPLLCDSKNALTEPTSLSVGTQMLVKLVSVNAYIVFCVVEKVLHEG